MKQILIGRFSVDKKAVSVIENGVAISYRTMAFNDDSKMIAAINFFKRKYNLKDRDIEYV